MRNNDYFNLVFLTFSLIPLLSLICGKTYRNWYFWPCWKVIVARLWDSGYQAMFCGSCWQSLEANRSKKGFPKWLQFYLKTDGKSFDLLLSWKFQGFQCVVWLLKLGICSPVKSIFLSMRYSQIFFIFRLNFCAGCLPCSTTKRGRERERAVILSIRRWIEYSCFEFCK